MSASRPTRDWGPAKLEHRKMVDYVPGFVVNPRTSYLNEEDSKKLMKLQDCTFA